MLGRGRGCGGGGVIVGHVTATVQNSLLLLLLRVTERKSVKVSEGDEAGERKLWAVRESPVAMATFQKCSCRTCSGSDG